MNFIEWGTVDYAIGVERQLQLVAARVQSDVSDTCIICTHPPVVTLGRGTREGDLLGWAGEVQESSRGGRATYHGPNQVVIYPIVKLDETPRHKLKTRDLHGYLKQLELAIIFTLGEYGLLAQSSEERKKDEIARGMADGREFRGVWINGKKIASLGIAVKRWVTYHGAAINLDHDPKAFTGINPCGFSVKTMTSIEEQLGHKVDRQEFINKLKKHLADQLS